NRRARLAGQLGEGFGRVGGEIGEHLAVEFDAGQREAVHELRVVQPVDARRGADADDPEAAEVALLALAAWVGELQPALDRLLGRAVELRLRPAVALRQTE